MGRYRYILFYSTVVVACLLVIFGVIKSGKLLEIGRIQPISGAYVPGIWEMIKDTFQHQFAHPVAVLLIQLVTIIAIARIFGFLFIKIGQPTVVGEIVAGIVLGPSALGLLFPDLSQALFPASSLGNLQLMSQVGLVLFMFVIGMELDLSVLRSKAADAVVISHASIILPYTLGMGLAYFLYAEFAPDGVRFLSFSLFMGIAMSITAFPVLARIIQERNLTKTRLGTIALTCAAADDITAWCILAMVIAIVKAGSGYSALLTIALAVGYVLVMIKLIKPFLQRFGEIYTTKETVSQPVVAVMFIILLLSALAAELIGIHALFGAFLAGVIMPQDWHFRKILVSKIEDVALVLLLPLFFVFTGLRTEIGLLNSLHLWGVCALVIFVAVLGKLGGSTIAARFVGQNWRDSLSIGVLMNTRGLMELVVLNIGYDLGILSPEIFAIMVIMALVTTFMTGPALELINKLLPEKKVPVAENGTQYDNQWFKVLFTFANPARSKSLLRLSDLLAGERNSTKITALHLTPGADISPLNIPEYESESFKTVDDEAKKLSITVTKSYKVSNDVTKDILQEAERGQYDLLLVGAGRSIYQGTLLGQLVGLTAKALNPEKLLGSITRRENLLSFKNDHLLDDTTMEFIDECDCSVGVFLDKEFESANKILIPFLSVGDMFLLLYARRLLRNSQVNITITDMAGILRTDPGLRQELNSLLKAAPQQVTVSDDPLDAALLSSHDLLLLSYPGWKKISATKEEWLEALPSTLLIRA